MIALQVSHSLPSCLHLDADPQMEVEALSLTDLLIGPIIFAILLHDLAWRRA